VLFETARHCRLQQPRRWLPERLAVQIEGPEVNGHHQARVLVLEELQGLFGIHVVGMPVLVGAVAPHGNGGQIERTEPLADLAQ